MGSQDLLRTLIIGLKHPVTYNRAMSTQQAVRRWIMTGAITAITITGTIYGAGLKSKQEFREERKRALQATPEDRIAQLQAVRAELVLKKNELERKIKDISVRRLEEQKANKDSK